MRSTPRSTYLNAITAKDVEGAKIPVIVDTDEDALALALAACLRVDPASARIVRVRSTKHLELLWVSEPALPDVLATGRCEVVEAPRAIGTTRTGCSPTTCPTTGERPRHPARAAGCSGWRT